MSLFSTSTSGGALLAIPAMARTPPFDTVEVRLTATAGSTGRISAGRGIASASLAAAGVTTLALPAPMTLTSPTPGAEGAPGSGPRSGLTVRWSADPAADVVTVRLASQQGTPKLAWYVTAPATASGFTPFPLPAEVSPLRELSAGRYFVNWSSRSLGAGLGYREFFTEAYSPGIPDAWNTYAFGEVILQD